MKAPVLTPVVDNPTPRGGSYLQDPVTGELTPIFIPGMGMDPDSVLPMPEGTPETTAAAGQEEQV